MGQIEVFDMMPTVQAHALAVSLQKKNGYIQLEKFLAYLMKAIKVVKVKLLWPSFLRDLTSSSYPCPHTRL